MDERPSLRNIKRNYIYNLIDQVVNIICPLVTTYYVSRILGPNGIGKVSYAESITAYFVLLASMSIRSYYGQRAVAYVRDSVEERSRVFWETKLTGIAVSVIVLSFYFGFVASQFDRKLYIILSLLIIDVIFDVTWFFQGMEEFRKIVVRNSLMKVLSVFFVMLLVRDSTDVYIYALGNVLFTVIGNALMWLYLSQYIVRIPVTSIKPFRDFKTIISLFIPSIAINVYTVLDKTMIGLITKNNAENGYYEQAVKISRMSLTIITALGTVMISRIGYYHKRGEESIVIDYICKTVRFVWFLGIPLFLGLIGIADNLIPWFLGGDFNGSINLIKILSFLVVAVGISNAIGVQYLIPTGRQNMFTYTVVLGALLNFSLNIFMIKWYASIGAAISSVVTETLISAFLIFLVRKEIRPNKIFENISKYILSGIIMLGVLLAENVILKPSIFNTVLMTLSGGTIYIVCLFVLGDGFLKSIICEFVGKYRSGNK